MEKAVVLAAGRGTRMGELTTRAPKPLLEVAGKALVEHVLENMRQAGVRRALVVTGYQAELLESRLNGFPLEVEFRRQHPVDGTGSAALLAREFAGGDGFLLTYGDILADAGDYRGMAALMEQDPEADAVLGVNYVEDPWQGAAVYHEDGRVSRIVEKPPRGSSATRWNNSGVYVFRPAIFDYLARLSPSPRGEYELTAAVADMLAAGRRLLAFGLRGGWLDVGRPEDLAVAEKLVTGRASR
ncbi:MAG: NTP transferase domain-containing protein [Bryobacteraceae bacterium]|nr:NTP transferase domain-containing protein [Bryobacteraceae bacterium]